MPKSEEISDSQRGQYQGNRVYGELYPSPVPPMFTCLFSYMCPCVVVKKQDRSPSRPFLSNNVCRILKLISVNAAGDSVLAGATRSGTFVANPEAKKETFLGVKARFVLRRKVFSSREPHGAMRISIEEDPALISVTIFCIHLL